MAGAMLSFGGLLTQIMLGGAAGVGQANPGLLKILGGFLFPVGLVMSVSFIIIATVRPISCLQDRATRTRAIDQQHDGNLLGSAIFPAKIEPEHDGFFQTFPMAVLTRAIPWWSLPVNWIIGAYRRCLSSLFAFPS